MVSSLLINKQMKVTFQNQIHQVDVKTVNDFQKFQTTVKTLFKKLPNHYSFLYHVPNSSSPITLQNQGDFKMLITSFNKGQVRVQIQQRLQQSGGQQFISLEEKVVELSEIPFAEEKEENHLSGLDTIISEKLERILPGIIYRIKDSIVDHQIQNKAEQKNTLKSVSRVIDENVRKILNEYESIEKRLSENIMEIEDVEKLEKYLSTQFNKKMQELEKEKTIVCSLWEVLGEEKSEELEKVSVQIHENRKQVEGSLRIKKKEFEEILGKGQKEFRKMLKLCLENAEKVKQNSINQHQKMKNLSTEVVLNLKHYEKEAAKLNNHEKIFGFKATDYSSIRSSLKEIIPYQRFWKIVNLWKSELNSWRSMSLQKLRASIVRNGIEEELHEFNNLSTCFEQSPIQKEYRSISEQMKELRTYLPILKSLKVQLMKENHWEVLSQSLGFKIDSTRTLQSLIDENIIKFKSKCKKVGEMAEKEFQIMKTIEEVENNCKNEKIELDGSSMLFFKNSEKIQNFIIKELGKIKHVQDSSISASFKENITKLKQFFEGLQEIMAKSERFESQWKRFNYLFTPIFQARLPKSVVQIKKVKKLWKQVAYTIEISPTLSSIACSEDISVKINVCCNTMQLIEKQVLDYFETKRLLFPRYYFISNQKLADIYFKCDDFKSASKHVGSMFDSILKVNFDKNDRIIAMSDHLETIPLCRPIETRQQEIQTVFCKLEDEMKFTTRSGIKKSFLSYPSEGKNLVEWITSNSAQNGSAGSQLWRTHATQKAIKEGTLQSFEKTCLNKLVEMVNSTRKSASLSKNDALKIENSIIVDVHSRDILSTLKRNNAQTSQQFSYKSQLRHYWENQDYHIKCCQTDIRSFYEYIGNQEKLVLTPLTDRCFISIMSALQLNLGAAPAGPAGVGKTQSTKFLGRIVGQFCVTTNASDQFAGKDMKKILKGVASTGVWHIFDQFNRIRVQCLSSYAELLKTVLEAKAKREKKCILEGDEVKINPNYHFIITMNPGYAGRTQLPDNLKALFRPCSMMVPDYVLICECKLYSYGLQQAEVLAKKIIHSFRTFSEQLSSQDHYDFGMRAVKSVLHFSQIQIRNNPEMDETEVVFRAINNNMLAKVVKNDLPLFKNIMKDIFPTMNIEIMNKNDRLVPLIEQTFRRNNLQPTEYLVQRTLELEKMMRVRHGIKIVGKTRKGKTTILNVLKQVLQSDGNKVINKYVIGPKSLSIKNIYGYKKSESWCDGILPSILKNIKERNNQNQLNWIIFDGPIDPQWIESLNTLLDDNKTLYLVNGEAIPLIENTRIFFEALDLKTATPATVSRCGMIHLDENIPVSALTESWLNKLPENVQNQKVNTTLRYLFENFVEETIVFMKKCGPLIQVEDEHLVESLLRLLTCQINAFIQTNSVKDLENCIVEVFHWCLVWSIGTILNASGRKQFDKFVRQLSEKKLRKVFPNQGIVFDYHYDIKKKCLTNNWKLQQFQDNQIIQTKEFCSNLQLAQILASNNYPVLLVGNSFSGKSLQFNELIELKQNDWKNKVELELVGNSDDIEIQKMIEKKCQVNGSTCSFGKYKDNWITIDDVDLPKISKYGSQLTSQFLIYLLEHGNFWKLQTTEKMQLPRLCVLASCSADKFNKLPHKFISKFNVIGCPDISDETTSQIYRAKLSKTMKASPENIRSMNNEISETCVKIINQAKKTVPETEIFNNYNIKDGLKIIQSLNHNNLESIKNQEDLLQFLYHESLRVLSDRISLQANKKDLREGVQLIIQNTEYGKHFVPEQIDLTNYLGNNNGHKLFCGKSNGQMMKRLEEKVQRKIEEYELENKKSSNLFVHPHLCENLAKVSKALRGPQGNVFLVGQKCNSKKSMVKLACHILSIQVNEFKGDSENWDSWFKDVIMKILSEDKSQCILIGSNSKLKNDLMMKISSLLKKLNLENLLTYEEKIKLQSSLGNQCELNNVMKVCSEKIKTNLHFALCMDPSKTDFPIKIKEFPIIFNELTVVWIKQMERETSIAVGRRVLEITDSSKKVMMACQKINKYISQNSCQDSQISCAQDFLELLKVYRNLSTSEKQKIESKVSKYLLGYQKFEDLEKCLKVFHKQLLLSPKSQKLVTCEYLLKKLTERKQYWEKEIKRAQEEQENFNGDYILFACMITYKNKVLERQKLIENWRKILFQENIKYSSDWENKYNQMKKQIPESLVGEECPEIILANEFIIIQNPSLVDNKNKMEIKFASSKQDLQQINNKLLERLACCTGNILDDKVLRELINDEHEIIKQLEKCDEKVENLRKECHRVTQTFQPIVKHAQMLYSCLQQVSKQSPLVKYSFKWFVNFFNKCVQKTESTTSIETRVMKVNETLTYEFYKYISCQLFTRDKLLLACLIAGKIMKKSSKITSQQWNFFVSNHYVHQQIVQNKSKMEDVLWMQIYPQLERMKNLTGFQDIEKNFLKNQNQWNTFISSNQQDVLQKVPEPYNKLHDFEKILLVKAFCPENLIFCLRKYIEGILGQTFTKHERISIVDFYKESCCTKPLLVIEEQGAPVVNYWNRFAKKMNMKENSIKINLNEFNLDNVKNIIETNCTKNRWVIIEHCHFYSQFTQEKLPEILNIFRTQKIHENFRLWFIIKPMKVPQQVIDNTDKIAFEKELKFRDTLESIYEQLTEEDLECEMKEQYKKIVFSCAMLFTTMIQRKKYAYIGMNIPYEFTDEDLFTLLKLIKSVLNQSKCIQWNEILYLACEISFGGRITDDLDRRLMNTLARQFINEQALKPGYEFLYKNYQQPKASNLSEYRKYIQTLPEKIFPNQIRLPSNSEKNKNINIKAELLDKLLPKREVNQSRKELKGIIESIEKQLPEMKTLEEVERKYPIRYQSCMNLTYCQQYRRYLLLIENLKSSLSYLKNRLKENYITSEEIMEYLLQNKVPVGWLRKSFPFLKSLSGWILEVRDRVSYMNQWYQKGTPKCIDLSKIFFPQAVMTAINQNYSRKNTVPYEKISLNYQFLDFEPSQIKQQPQIGQYLSGMMVQGGKWDSNSKKLVRNEDKDIRLKKMPVVHVIPTLEKKPAQGAYHCPLYKTLVRRGVLSTTGHSTNRVSLLQIPTELKVDECARLSIALFLSSDQ